MKLKCEKALKRLTSKTNKSIITLWRSQEYSGWIWLLLGSWTCSLIARGISVLKDLVCTHKQLIHSLAQFTQPSVGYCIWIQVIQMQISYAISGTSLLVQCLRLHASTAGGTGSIPGQGTKILPATWQKKKKDTWLLPKHWYGEVGILISMFQVRKLRLREENWLTQRTTASQVLVTKPIL